MNSASFKFPDESPVLEPQVFSNAFYYGVEIVFGREALKWEEIIDLVRSHKAKNPQDEELDLGIEMAEAYIKFFNRAGFPVYASMTRTFALFSLIKDGTIGDNYFNYGQKKFLVAPSQILAVAALLPMITTKKFNKEDFLAALQLTNVEPRENWHSDGIPD